jgi:hypothetical protein
LPFLYSLFLPCCSWRTSFSLLHIYQIFTPPAVSYAFLSNIIDSSLTLAGYQPTWGRFTFVIPHIGSTHSPSPWVACKDDYMSSGYNISSGRTFSSNSSGVRYPSPIVASFSVVPSLCAFFAHLATSAKYNQVRPALCGDIFSTYYHSQGGCSKSSPASNSHSKGG